MSGLLISHLTNAYDVLKDLGERKCTQMVHNCRVITNILETAVGGWIVGSLCVECGFFEVAAQIEFKTNSLSKRFIETYEVR